MTEARIVEVTESLIVNLAQVTYIVPRANGDMDIFVVGRERAIGTAKGKQAKNLQEAIKQYNQS